MKITITYNNEKYRVELFFTGSFPEGLTEFMRKVGYRNTPSNSKKWYAPKHPAYVNFANSLKEVLKENKNWKTAKINPSFEPSLENINNSKFSVIKIHFTEKQQVTFKEYVLFDSYNRIANEIASRFAIAKYGKNFKELEVFSRSKKTKARELFKERKIIAEEFKPDIVSIQETALDQKKESGSDTQDSIILILKEVIATLLSLEEKLTGESETIIGTTLFDLEEALEETNEIKFKKQLNKSVELFRDWADDLTIESRIIAVTSINRLIERLEGAPIPIEKKVFTSKAISKDIFNRDHIVPNVLVPLKAGEPFQSGGINIGDGNFLKLKFPELYKINDENLNEVSGLSLFQLSQMPHPKDYGILVNRSALLQEWENRGSEAFEEIGYPIDLDYPYVNIHTGYKSVSTLGKEIGAYDDRHRWWSSVEHSRPVADLGKGISIIDDLLLELVENKTEFINPKTKNTKTDKKSKEAVSDIEWKMERLERSKQVIVDFQNKNFEDEQIPPKELPETTTPKEKEPNDYLDKVIAITHTAFAKAERLTKKKVERLKEETGAPTMGALWEAVELSWLLWYKMLYKEPIPFEARLKKMVLFWNNVQPTYAYSDSSKELYKQYSTPCPIGAIIAQYTGMDNAEFIFEPSAGNGLLLVGANPRITHVNEIDKSRKESLKYQGFGRITSDNAAEPFPEIMTKVHDVVVTNPPFASWEASKFDKERIANKYFNKQRGIANHIRLEHLMAGLALHTMTDTGKAAIIIMGHVFFGDDGLFAKYRPFFNWLYRFYHVDDIVNMNSYKLYNKQGAVTKTMLILIGGRKHTPSGVAPNKTAQPHLETMVETFEDLWQRVKLNTRPTLKTIVQQLKTAKTK